MTKTKSEAYDIYNDIDGNLAPLLVQFANVHMQRADAGSKESMKKLKAIQNMFVGGIRRYQPMPEEGE